MGSDTIFEQSCLTPFIFHERLVLGFVIGIAIQKAAAGELGHLLTDQPLFVEAVTQALLRDGGVEGELVDITYLLFFLASQ